MFNTIDEVYNVYTVFHDGNKLDRRYVGRFACVDNELHLLEDHQGFLKHLQEGPISGKTLRKLQHMRQSQHMEVVAQSDIQGGHRDDLTPEEDLGPAADPVFPTEAAMAPAGGDAGALLAAGQVLPRLERPASVFDYKRIGMDNAQTVEFQGSKVLLNGHVLEHEEVERIIRNLKEGTATLRYKRNTTPAQVVQKHESLFEDLVKIEPHLADSLSHIRGAVKAGHLPESVLRGMTKEIFTDSMVPRMGNAKAYKDFLSRPKKGIHIRLDGNDFGQINKVHSFDHGNQAIIAMGNAMREAMDEAVGSKHGKLHRIGGDEFSAFVPTHEHAANFMRNLRSKLEKIPPIGGTHSLSVSAGFGRTPEESDQASIHAKGAKKKMNYQHGQSKTHVHSLVPGFEGAIPVHDEHSTANFSPPPKVAAPSAAPAAPAATTPTAPSPSTLSQPAVKS